MQCVIFPYIPLQLIEKWISSVISDRNDGKIADKTQVTLIWAVAVSIFCFGGMIGGLSTGFVAEKFGRKGGLLVSNALVVLSAALQGKSKSIDLVYMLCFIHIFLSLYSILKLVCRNFPFFPATFLSLCFFVRITPPVFHYLSHTLQL